MKVKISFTQFALILTALLCMASCPKEFIPDDEAMGEGYLFAPLPLMLARESFENSSPGTLRIETSGSPLDNRHGIFRLNMHRVGRADIVTEGRKNVLKLWQTTGPGGGTMRSDFIFVPNQDATDAILAQGKKVLLQYRIRLENVNNVNAYAVNVYHTRYPTGQPGGNTSVQARLNGEGTFQINNDNTWELNPVAHNRWHSVEMLIDYGVEKYMVYLNGSPLFDNYLYNRSSPAFGTVSWYCNNPAMTLFVSDIRVSTDAAL